MTESEEKRTQKQPPAPPPSSLVIHLILDTLWGIALLCIPMMAYDFRYHDPELPKRSVFASEKLLALSIQCTSVYGILVAISAALGLVFGSVRRLRQPRILWLYPWTHCFMAVGMTVIYIATLAQVYHIRECAVKTISSPTNSASDYQWFQSQLDTCVMDSGMFSALAEAFSGVRPYDDSFCAPDFTSDCVQSIRKFVTRTAFIVYLQIAFLILGQVIITMERVYIYRILAAAGSRSDDDVKKANDENGHQPIMSHGTCKIIDI